MPRITILLPVYNAVPFLEETMNSILSQTFTDFEVLAIDDCSQDNSLEVLESFKDDRIRIVKNEKNLGIGGILNKGIELSAGEFLARMDADDLMVPQRLEWQVDFLEKNPEVDILGGYVELFDMETGIWEVPLSDDQIKARLFTTPGFAHPTVMFRMSLFQKTPQRYPLELPHIEDYYFWYKLIPVAKMANLPQVLLKYRRNLAGTTIANKKTAAERLKGLFRVMHRELNLPNNPRFLDYHLELTHWNTISFQPSEYYRFMELVLEKNAISGIFPQKALELEFKKRWEQLFYKLSDKKDFGRLKNYFSMKPGIKGGQLYYAFKKLISSGRK